MRIKKTIAVLLSMLLLCCVPVCRFGASAETAEEFTRTDATTFVFSDSEITVDEGAYTGYKVKGTALSITDAGTYILSGTCSNGSVTVKKGVKDAVVVLDGLTLSTTDATAPLVCNKSSAAKIVAADGTVNTLADNATNNDELLASDNATQLYPDAENAVIKCKDGSQITLCGTGTLNVYSYGKNAIKSGCTTEDDGEAWLKIRDLTLNIEANVNDGINAEEYLQITSGNITVSAVDDGIHCDRVMELGIKNGAGPDVKITKSTEGIEAATLTVYAGKYEVHASDDGFNAANSDFTDYAFSLTIAGGNVYVDAGGDGLDSNGTLTLSGGTVEVYSSSRNDNSPLDSDGTFSVTGATVFAVGSSGMAQTPSGTQYYFSFGSNGTGGMFGGFGKNSTVSISAGDTITVCNTSDTVLYTGKALRAAGYVFFSSPSLTANENGKLKINGTEKATATASNASGRGGNQPGGDNPGEKPDDNTGGNRSSSDLITRLTELWQKLLAFFKKLFNIAD